MRRLCAILALVSIACLAACGGGGGGGPTPPTVTAVAPNQGGSTGGTAVTITGTGFAAGATVGFGGNPATSVVVVGATTITCVTPAGTVGTVDVQVVVSGLTGTLTSAFTYYPPPTATNVVPPATSDFGGTPITITGTGFTANAAGTNTVTVGGTPATNVVAVNDTTLTCVTPAGPAGVATVVVTNANGTANTPFALFEPILVADGGGNPPPASWDLWAFDPGTGNAHLVGPIGFGVTGMDFDPTGTLYGTTAPGGAGGPRQLITINPVTGAGAAVANLDDAGAVNHVVPDVSFFLGALYGTDGWMGNFVAINVASGLVTVGGLNPFPLKGYGFAVDLTSANTYYMTSDIGLLYTVNVPTAAFLPGPALSGFALPGGALKSATFHQGTLYALDADAVVPGAPSVRQIVSINTATGAMTMIGAPMPSLFASAIASRTR